MKAETVKRLRPVSFCFTRSTEHVENATGYYSLDRLSLSGPDCGILTGDYICTNSFDFMRTCVVATPYKV